MRKFVRLLICSGVLVAGSSPALANEEQEDPLRSDLLCIAATAVIAGGEEGEAREAGTLGTIYFIGKVFGKEPDIDLEKRLTAVLEDIEVLGLIGEIPQCLSELQERADELTQVGDALSKTGS